MTNLNKKIQSTRKTKRTPSFNIVYEDSNVIIPEINDSDLLNFSITFMKIRERELTKSNVNSVKTQKG